MQNPNSLFNEAFYLINREALDSIQEDYYTQIHNDPNFIIKRKLTFKANKDDYKKAIALFEQFITCNPNCKYAYLYCGVAKGHSNDFQGAIAAFTKVIEIDPDYELPYIYRGQTQSFRKNYKEAIEDYTIAIKLNSKVAKNYELRGESRKNLYDYKGAIKDFTKCIQLNPKNYNAFRLRGFSFLYLNRYEKAIEDFNWIYEKDFKNFGDFHARGKAYLELKKYQNAIDDLEIAVAQNCTVNSIKSLLQEAKIKLNIEEQTKLEIGMPSKKTMIIEAFSKMDISLLEILLDDYKTYQDATKEIFLEKIKKLFDEFKQKKDTELIPFNGKCNGKTCDNFGCTGFSFVGNVSKSHIPLIFEETENNFKDIYECCQFKSEKKIKGLKEKKSIEILTDDKAYFFKSSEYLVKVDGAKRAFDEIATHPPQLLDFEQLSYWINKHDNLYSQIGGYDVFEPIMIWTPFLNLYDGLKLMKDYIEANWNQIETASMQFKSLKAEQSKIDWILKNESLYKLAPIYLHFDPFNDDIIQFKIDDKTKILFLGKHLNETYHFCENFKVINRKLLKKYIIYTDEEFQIKNNDHSIKNIQQDLYRLSYHIEKRAALEKIGVNIPFYKIEAYIKILFT